MTATMAPPISRSVPIRPICRTRCVSSTRVLSRSQSTQAKENPPESPNYVFVPQPRQFQAVDPPKVKGILPKPRDLFKPTAPDRTSFGYLRKTSAYPKSALYEKESATPAKSKARSKGELAAFRDRMSDIRRRSIREGLLQLKTREDHAIAKMAAKSSEKQRINRENLERPERDDDRLTAPTILPTVVSLASKPLSDVELAAKRARYEAKEAAKHEERNQTLHTLYMNARDFITTESQLNAKISEVFDDPFWQNENDPSMWAKEGLPERLTDILTRVSGTKTGGTQINETYSQITRDRLQVLAEKLTGGKMEKQERIDKREGKKPGYY